MAALCTIHYLPAKINTQIQLPSITTQKFHLRRSISIQFNRRIWYNFCCKNNEGHNQTGFSMLESNPPWESEDVWSTIGFYFFSLHIPMSFGGLSVVAHLLHQSDLEPQIKAIAILVIETVELFCALLLLQFTAKHKPVNFFQLGKMQRERNWMFTAVLGFISLVLAMFFTALIADKFDGIKGMSDQTVKEILLSGSVASTACTLVYCVIAPLLEEIVYRRFLLTSLAPSMEWYKAVMLSSVIFSAAHLSGENFIQLVVVGMVLGCSYCWTGDLRSSIFLHSMYNALTLLLTVFA
ncbi:putative membrane peptidase YdiL [Bienertia sinuspersici]